MRGTYSNPLLRKPATFTTVKDDFKKSLATQIGVGIRDLREPVVLVVKKNSSTLTNLISWLRDNNPHNLHENPMLLIDDEADQASINTRLEGIAAINGKIRELLELFGQSSYVGYTATPFANIFIDPDDEDAAINGKIRELLELFGQSSYVGYTATPFANIFIDPDDEDAMLGDNLFPRDFILSLDPPDNYVGPDRVFSSEG